MNKTKEQLEAMTQEELIAYAIDLQGRVDLWTKSYNDVNNKLTSVRSTLKALAQLSEA